MINEPLSGQLEAEDAPRAANSGLPGRSEPAETTDDLIDPALLFPELTTGKAVRDPKRPMCQLAS